MEKLRYLKEEISDFIQCMPEKSIYTCNFEPPVEFSITKISKTNNKINGDLDRLINQYKERGFALFEVDQNNSNHEIVKFLSRSLGLGEPYVPARYANGDSSHLYEMGINTISTHINGRAIHQSKDDRKVKHAFTTANEQQLHVDGTLEEIGLIKTSILLCVTPAFSGGETVIFNSVSAFVELAKHDINAAISLLNPKCLKRMDLAHGDTYTGPVFMFREGELFSRFSLDKTSCWKDGLNSVESLDRAYSFLTKMTKKSSPFFCEMKLEAGQGIIIANDKISHGRKSYIQSQIHARTMLRGIFLEAPSAD